MLHISTLEIVWFAFTCIDSLFIIYLFRDENVKRRETLQSYLWIVSAFIQILVILFD